MSKLKVIDMGAENFHFFCFFLSVTKISVIAVLIKTILPSAGEKMNKCKTYEM